MAKAMEATNCANRANYFASHWEAILLFKPTSLYRKVKDYYARH